MQQIIQWSVTQMRKKISVCRTYQMGRLRESLQHFHLPLHNYKDKLIFQLLKAFHMLTVVHTRASLAFQSINCFCATGCMHFSLMNKIQAESWAHKHTICAVLEPAWTLAAADWQNQLGEFLEMQVGVKGERLGAQRQERCSNSQWQTRPEHAARQSILLNTW